MKLEKRTFAIANEAEADMNSTYIIDYTNHQGVRYKREIKLISYTYEPTNWYQNDLLKIKVFDLTKKAERILLVENIHSWREIFPDGSWGKTITKTKNDPEEIGKIILAISGLERKNL